MADELYQIGAGPASCKPAMLIGPARDDKFHGRGRGDRDRSARRLAAARALRADTAELLDLFLPWVARPGRLAIAQLGQSLDGRIATASGPRTISTA